MKIRMLLTAVMVIIIPMSVSFGKKAEKETDKCTEQFHKALNRYEKGRYQDVRISLDELKYQCSGHPLMDSILYYLGSSLLKVKSYAEARIEFERLMQDFPRSPFADEAHFRVGHASYMQSNPPQKDQTQTYVAIRAFSGFLQQRPESEYADSARVYIDKAHEKLAEKEYLNARFYEKIQKYESAAVYFRDLIERFSDSKYIPEARLALAENLLRLSRPSEAQSVLEELVESNPSKEIKRRAQQILKQQKRRQGIAQKPQPQPSTSQEPEPQNGAKEDRSAPVIDEDTESIMIDSPQDATEEAATEETATEETATEDAAAEDAATEDAATEDAATEDAATEEAATEEAATEEAATEEAATEEAATEEAATEEAATEEAATEETATEEAATEETATEEAATEEATTEDATTEDATTEDATTEDATTEDATTEDATTEETATEEDTTEKDDSGSTGKDDVADSAEEKASTENADSVQTAE